jgi:hypothetical protein
MNYQYLYDEFIAKNYAECYGNEDRMMNNWERGFAFDAFADSLNLTEAQLLELLP